jgi:hypothetical protein
LVFCGYSPQLSSSLRERIAKIQEETYEGKTNLGWQVFDNEKYIDEANSLVASSDGVILYPRILRKGNVAQDFELVRKAQGDLSVVLGDYKILFDRIGKTCILHSRPVLMFFNSRVPDSDREKSQTYQDWQGERDRRVHNFPWAKNFSYVSLDFGNSHRIKKENEELDKHQFERFLDFAIRPAF